MFINESLVADRLYRREKPVTSGCMSSESREGSNIRGDLMHIRGISIQLPDVSAVISMTRCKFPSLNLKIKTGESRRMLNEYLASISVRQRVLPHDFHSSSLRELSMKGSVDEHPRINSATEWRIRYQLCGISCSLLFLWLSVLCLCQTHELEWKKCSL